MMLNRYEEVDGDLITLAREGKFDVIAHGCNCHSTMGAGIAPQMVKAFGCDQFVMERIGSDVNKLGNIDYQQFILTKLTADSIKNGNFKPELTVVNAYTQFNYGRNHADGDSKPLSYEALTLCMKKINILFAGKHIGLPKIGAGLAGGDWEKIKGIIQRELVDCKVTIVNYKK
jgi:O-acetyl-ADP-ribose deacetylase (regulator of RNase III)